MRSVPKPYGHVIAVTGDGKVVDDLQDPSGASSLTTGVTETADRLYIHNANGGSLGWLPSNREKFCGPMSNRPLGVRRMI